MYAFRMFLFSWMLGALIVATGTAQPKPKASGASKPAEVTGRVFAITRDGDLKPARMATVYLLYMYRSATSDAKDSDSVGSAWEDNFLKELKTFNEEYAQKARSWTESIACHRHLMAYTIALRETLEWTSNAHKEWQLTEADADESGYFKIPVPHPGIYILLARGQAGFNDAFWDTDNFVVHPGAQVEVKMSKVEQSCPKVEP